MSAGLAFPAVGLETPGSPESPTPVDTAAELARASRVVARQPAPGFRADLVRRARLVARLREARSATLVLLTAPAGYGKTTLLAEWAAEDDRPFVWVRLVDGDNDPALFVASVIDALDEMKETLGEVPERLGEPKVGASTILLSRLARAVRARRRPFVLVFDDVHVLRNRESLAALTAIIDQLPSGSQVALASRTEPALRLGRRRAHRGLAELKQRDLTMTRSEGGDLLARMGLKLDPTDAARLFRRAEGWPVAIYLAGLSLRGQRDLGRAVARFTGDDRLVVDYLRDEFLAGLSRRKLEFLTRTSVLDTLAGPICDAVLERSGSAQVLRELARANTLLVPLDRSDHAYRYHPLFAEMLKAELRRREPESEPALHRRASAWYAESLDSSQAIEHSIAAGDVERAAELICDSLSDYLNRGSLATIRSWLHRFSDEQIATSPPLCLAAATVALANGDGALSEHWARIGVKALDDARATAVSGSLASAFTLIRASLARDGIARMDADAARAAESLSHESPWLAECCLLRGIAAHLGGDHERAKARLDEGARRGAVVAPLVQVLCLAQLALLVIERGDWNAGARLVGRARAQVERFGLAPYPSVALVPAICALVDAHRGRVEDARRDLRRSIRLLHEVVDFPSWYEAEIGIVLAHAAMRLDEPNCARQRLTEATAVLDLVPGVPVLDALLRRARSSLDASIAAANGDSGLTPAELRTLQYLPSHYSFREIGEELVVSVNTVRSQARAVYRKLGASTRREAVELARKRGLIEPRSEPQLPIPASSGPSIVITSSPDLHDR